MSPATMAAVLSEILGNLSAIANQPGEPSAQLDRIRTALDKSWNAVEHFTRSLCTSNGVELSDSDLLSLRASWERRDGLTFKERIQLLLRGEPCKP